jgi:hypothetical protein
MYLRSRVLLLTLWQEKAQLENQLGRAIELESNRVKELEGLLSAATADMGALRQERQQLLCCLDAAGDFFHRIFALLYQVFHIWSFCF